MKDRFHPKLYGNGLKVTNDKVTHTLDFNSSYSALLSNVVSKGIHTWRFKQIGPHDTFIGIVENSIDLTKTKYSNGLYY